MLDNIPNGPSGHIQSSHRLFWPMNEHPGHFVHIRKCFSKKHSRSSTRLVCLERERARESLWYLNAGTTESSSHPGRIQHSVSQDCKMDWVLDNIHLRSWACVHHCHPGNKLLKDGARDEKGSTESSDDLKQHTLRKVETT